MANDGFHNVTTSWTQVSLDGQPITNGVYSIVSLSPERIGFIKSTSQPTGTNGVYFFNDAEDSAKYNLLAGEYLWAKAVRKASKIGVIPS